MKSNNKNKNNYKVAAILFWIAGGATLLNVILDLIWKEDTIGTAYIGMVGMWICLGGLFWALYKRHSKTISYYDENAAEFVAATEGADMSETRNRFLAYIPAGGLILDWGCGSGRDSLAFKEAGYRIEATDASEELCKIAGQKLNAPVFCESFEDLANQKDYKEKFDGIWACASLLHLGRDFLPETFELAMKALKPGGAMYASFKYGDFEGERNGRYFTDLNEKRFAKVIKGLKKFELKEQWITTDVRPDRADEKWLNVILVKKIQ